MNTILEIGLVVLYILIITFPLLWCNLDHISRISKIGLKEYLKEQAIVNNALKKSNIKLTTNKILIGKICTQHQPFEIDEEECIKVKREQIKNYAIICNFSCDGNCQFKGFNHYL